jgi:pimeloyl-ACP methyl ester carboxylesterase
MKSIGITGLFGLILVFGFNACKNVAAPTIYSKENTPIEYTIEGAGEKTVVFVHGWSCDRSYWDLQVPYFAENYTVVAVDLPGHGESSYNREEWNMEAFGEDVAAVVEGLDLRNVVLVGHSMGGAVILTAASNLGNRVTALVGVDTFQDLESAIPEEDELDAFIQPFQDNFVETTRNFVRSMFYPTADSLLVEQIANDMSAAPQEVALGSFNGLFAFNPIPVLEQIAVPIYGINSDMYPVNVEAGKRHTIAFEIQIMEGRGHFLHQEDPETFNRMLEDILEEIF